MFLNSLFLLLLVVVVLFSSFSFPFSLYSYTGAVDSDGIAIIMDVGQQGAMEGQGGDGREQGVMEGQGGDVGGGFIMGVDEQGEGFKEGLLCFLFSFPIFFCFLTDCFFPLLLFFFFFFLFFFSFSKTEALM